MTTALGTRAIAKFVQPGSDARCALCDKWVKFVAKRRPVNVFANVYEGDRWDRLEVFHGECYVAAGEPYGPADRANLLTRHR